MPDRAALQAGIRRATFAAHKNVEQLDAVALRELEQLYRDAAKDIAGRIRAHAGADDSVALEELRSLLSQVEARITDLSGARNALLDRTLMRATDIGVRPYTFAGNGVRAVFTDAAAMATSSEALAFVRSFVAADGLQLSDRIWRLDRGARDAVINQIEQSVIEGHGAAQAAREFLARGQPVPLEIQQKTRAANAAAIERATTTQMLTGNGNPMDNAMRLFRTEINRAHGEAYMAGGEDTPGFAAWRYLLSPAHPEPDICDLLSTQNLYGLGAGCYPTREKTPWPAHPNTLSFIVMKFLDEVTEADRAGKETPMEALKRLTPAQQVGVLGQGKKEILDAGQLRQGMIRTPLSAVRMRIRTPIAPPPKPAPKERPRAAKPSTLDEMLAAGRIRADKLLAGGSSLAFPERLLAELRAERSLSKAAKVPGKGVGAELVRDASQHFPDSWTRAADRSGPLSVTFRESRAYYVKYPDGRAEMAVRDLGSAVHEYSHHLQHALPRLDDYFQDLHARRTRGEQLRQLRALIPGSGYGSHEVAREDKYISPYQGKEYQVGGYLGKHGALEVMTMAFESVLGGRGQLLRQMINTDREMIDLVVGLLFNYAP